MSDHHTELAAGLRQLASFIEANPQLADEIAWTMSHLNLPIANEDNPKAIIAAFARAALRSNGKVAKEYDGNSFAGIRVHFGPVRFYVYADRDQVCERVVIGTETVTEQVPDPNVEVPLVEVTREVEKVEWRCSPLLAGGESQ